MNEQQLGIRLSKREARALAWRVIERYMRYNEDWLYWEDYPRLDEDSFRMMAEMIKGEMADTTRQVSAMYDKQWGIDAAAILERARG